MEYGPETYGEGIADVYDDWYRGLGEGETEAALLAELAEGGRALELGIGTGRVAVALAARGVEVHGVDASPAMIAKLREKPGSETIAVSLGDMADVPVDGSFSLIFVVFNTLFMLPSQEAQVRCFANAAAHLAPGGRFVVDAFVPDLSRIEKGQYVGASTVAPTHVRLDATRFDPLTQLLETTHVRISQTEGIRLQHLMLRYAFPAELDLMAQLAGLTLEHQWSTFDKQRFTSESGTRVAVYRA